MKFSRKRLLAAVAALLLLPAAGWYALLTLGYVGSAEDLVSPSFKPSDRIATIEVSPDEEGVLRATFYGWEEGKPGLTSEEFFEEILQRKRNLPRIYRLFDVTSPVGVVWVIFGFMGQAVFTARMIVQWQASERAKNSVVPPAFWWLSILGASMLMIYFIWRKDIVGFLGQSTGWAIYLRNLWFIYGRNSALRSD